MSDLLEIVIVFVLFVFIRIEEDFVWLNFVVKFVSFLMVDLIYIDEDMLDVCILLELSDFLFLNDLRLVGRVLKRVVMEYLYVFLVIVLFVFKLLNVEVVQVDNVMEFVNFLVNDFICINEGMLDVYFLRGFFNVFDLDEVWLVDNFVEMDYIDLLEVVVVLVLFMFIRKKQVVLFVEVLVDLVSLVVFEFICIVEEVLDLKCFEELF